MIIWTMKRINGDVAYIRTLGRFEYAADVRTSTGQNDNANWPKTFNTANACRRYMEQYGFKLT